MEDNGKGKVHFKPDGQIDFQLKKLNVTDKDIVVVRIPRDEASEQARADLLIMLRKAFPKNELLMVGSKLDLNVLPRRTLNAMGWFKKDDTEQVEQTDVKVGIKDFEKYIQRVELMNFMKGKAEDFGRQIKAELEKELGVIIEAKVGIFVKEAKK